MAVDDYLLIEDTLFSTTDKEKIDSVTDKLISAYINACDAFKKETGLQLYLNYHNSEEEGSRYDDVDGGFWAMDFHEVYKMTPEAEALSKKTHFGIRQYVSYG